MLHVVVMPIISQVLGEVLKDRNLILKVFNRLYDQFVNGDVAEEFLRDCEWRDNLFPHVNWRYYI